MRRRVRRRASVRGSTGGHGPSLPRSNVRGTGAGLRGGAGYDAVHCWAPGSNSSLGDSKQAGKRQFRRLSRSTALETVSEIPRTVTRGVV